MRIRNRVQVVMIGFLVLVTAGFTGLLYQVQYLAYVSGIDNELRTAALMAKELLPADYHDQINGKGSVSDREYQQIVDRFDRLSTQAHLETIWSLMLLDGKTVITSAASPAAAAHGNGADLPNPAGFLGTPADPTRYTQTFETMQPQYQINNDPTGRVRSVLLPFYDGHGRKYLIGASRSMQQIDSQVRTTLLSTVAVGGSVLLLGLLASILLGNSLARPLEQMTHAAVGIAQGHLSQIVEVNGTSELELLATSINIMSWSIQEQMRDLDESRENLQITLQSIGDAVMATNANGLVTWMNPIAESLTGWSQAEAQGKPLEDVFHIAHADTHLPLEHPVSVVLREGEMIHLTNHTVLIQKGGQERHISNSAAPIRDKNAAIVGAVLVFRDVTERYESDQTLRKTTEELESFFSLALDLLCIADTDGHFLRLNRSWETALGYSQDELKGRQLTEFVHPEDIQATQAVLADLADQKVILNFDNRFRCKDGTYRWIEWRSRAVGNIVYSAAHDITERKQSEEAIQQLNADLERRVRERTAQLEMSNKELEAFAYSVSHDLRAPLRGIDGFSLALLEEYGDKLDENGQHYLRRVRTAAQHMGRLIEGLLKLSRVTRSEMKYTTVNLSQIVGRLAEELHETQPDRRVEWAVAPGILAVGDEQLLEAGLSNLLGNAFKFTSQHATGHIEFGCKEQDGQLVYFVRDDGAGFDMAYAGRMFGVFNRLHNNQEFEGTGIGLAIVQRIIHRHGGQIWAEAAVEQGSTFYFTLADPNHNLRME